jgi:hypothetical protein
MAQTAVEISALETSVQEWISRFGFVSRGELELAGTE